ncbi:hypothetical protein PILCRDRAFT_752346 [Piloderma croceum F 1598]|uniref:Uncharacterized protein n=1 Tax=Piloderma croceum (strain F 1598) TaxID=765440 RepID=A0A0C3B2T9_PILCF|nr:hypothetical protein PILCRDRAFT_752346 [Piloderma croceum F 1598]
MRFILSAPSSLTLWPAPHLQISQTLLYTILATTCYLFQLSGRLSGLCLAYNLAMSLSLHQSQDYLSLSSYRLSTIILEACQCLDLP